VRYTRGKQACRFLWLVVLALAIAPVTGLASTQVDVLVSNTSCASLRITQVVFLLGPLPVHFQITSVMVPTGQTRTLNYELSQAPTSLQIGGTRDGQSFQASVSVPGQTPFVCGTIEVTVGGAAPPPAAGTVQLTRWSIPTTNAHPQGIGVAADGKVYFTEFNTNKIGELDPAANQIRERSVDGGPYGLYVSPGGTLHYTLAGANAVETMVFHGGTSRANLPTPAALPGTLVAAPTGPGQVNLWLPERNAGKVARFAPAQIPIPMIYITTLPTTVPPMTSQLTGALSTVAPQFHPGNPMLPPPIALLMPTGVAPFTEWEGPSEATRVAVAPDGRIWFTDGGSLVTVLDPTTNTMLYYGLPSGTQALAVVVGPDGRVWFTDTSQPAIGVVNPDNQDVRLWPIPGGVEPFDLVRDSAGNIWFTDRLANAIGQLNPSTDQVVLYPLGGNTRPAFLALDTQEQVWFTAERGNYVGRLAVAPVLGPPPGDPPPSGQGTLQVNSTPSGAQVFIDGVYRGTTPLTVQVTAGTRTVVVRLSGYPDAQRTVNIVSGGVYTMNATFGTSP